MEDNSKGGPSIAFFGTPNFSVDILNHLKEAGLTPELVVATPDKPQGRKMIITPPPTKVWAEENNVLCIQPKTLKKNLPEELTGGSFDLFIVASYGKIIPQEVLDLPEHGTLNVHPSLLPLLRGASPIQSSILQDLKETGVTIMLLDADMDHGPIIAQATVEIENWPPKASMLMDLLAQVGGDLLTESILPWINGDIKAEEQDHDKATYIDKIEKEDGLLDIENGDPYKNYLKIQAFDMGPGTYFFADKGGKKIRVKIIDAEYKNKKLTLTRVVPEGKKEMDFADFERGLNN